MAEILICPVGAIDKAALRDLRKAGVVVVQTNDPDRCRFIRAASEVSSDEMLWAAMSVLYSHGGSTQREQFTKLLFGLLDAKRASAAESVIDVGARPKGD